MFVKWVRIALLWGCLMGLWGTMGAAWAEQGTCVLTDKTLVSWVSLDNLTQQGGSALTLKLGDQFDAIVFGEREAGKWMLGSNYWLRSQSDFSGCAAETTAPGEFIQMAVVCEGTSVTLYRNAQRYDAYRITAPAAFYGGYQVLLGLRHVGGGGSPLAGRVQDARIYDTALSAEQLAALTPDQPSSLEPWAWWSFEDGQAVDHTGRFGPAQLLGDATVEDGCLKLDGEDDTMITNSATLTYDSPIHFRPDQGVFADPIPFYWQGQYHVFYLLGGMGKVSWQHIVSTDLIHWQQLPAALVSDGAEDGPDGMHMFTGSVIEKDGTFHIFYTGHNPNNPAGLEFIMHATSADLITWTKHPEDVLAPDGVHYATEPAASRNWRDPYVCWNEDEQTYWMVVIASRASDGQPVQGLLTSADLIHWQAQEPLAGAQGQECPDLFKIGATYYLIGGGHYSVATSARGPYQTVANNGSVIDSPGVYAGKRMFDGTRHIWIGWAWDTADRTDDDTITWGGYQCLPRELYAGPGGQLCCRPAAEVSAVFQYPVFDLASDAGQIINPLAAQWTVQSGGTLLGTPAPAASPCQVELPVSSYMLEATVRPEASAKFFLTLHEQMGTGEGYFLGIDMAAQTVELGSRDQRDKAFTWSRSCELDSACPVKIQVFMQGTVLECFVNDAYALTRRAYNFSEGVLGLNVTGGQVQVLSLKVMSDQEQPLASVSMTHLSLQ